MNTVLGYKDLDTNDLNIFILFREWGEKNIHCLQKKTCGDHQKRVEKFLWWGKITVPADITYWKIQDYINSLGHLQPSSLLNYRYSISGFCKFLHMRGYLPGNPCQMVSSPRPIIYPPDYLSAAEIEQFIDRAEELGYALMVKVAIYTGLRRAELCHMQWCDIDWERHMMQVYNKRDCFTVKNRKNRVVPIMDGLFRELRAEYDRRQPGPRHYIFQSRYYDQHPLCLRTWDRVIASLKHLFPGRVITWRILRHTFASTLAQRGVSHMKIATWLGNSPTVCEKFYCNAGQQWDPDINRLRAQEKKG